MFQKLYAGATDEQRRAMIKSYQESNGTSLSTSWKDVQKGKVETLPPDVRPHLGRQFTTHANYDSRQSMVAKKWEQ